MTPAHQSLRVAALRPRGRTSHPAPVHGLGAGLARAVPGAKPVLDLRHFPWVASPIHEQDVPIRTRERDELLGNLLFAALLCIL
jgi:hypothetical protein